MRYRTSSSATGRRWLLLVSLVLGVLLTVMTVLTPGPASLASPAAPAEDGLYWKLVHNASEVHWNRLYFVDRQVGYAVGGYGWDDDPYGSLNLRSSFAKTTDGG